MEDIKKGDLLKRLFPKLEIHTRTTAVDKLKKVSEEHRELLTATDTDNMIDEAIDLIKASTALLVDSCEKLGVDLTEALLKNDRKVLKKYPLAQEDK